MQRRGGDCRVAHRDADLIEREDDVACGVDGASASALLLIDRDTAPIRHVETERLGKMVVRFGTKRRIDGVEAELRAVAKVNYRATTGAIEAQGRSFFHADTVAFEKGAVVGADIDCTRREYGNVFGICSQEQGFSDAPRIGADNTDSLVPASKPSQTGQ